MTKGNTERVLKISDAEFHKYAAQELSRRKFMLRVVKKVLKAKQKALGKGEPFTLDSVRNVGELGTVGEPT